MTHHGGVTMPTYHVYPHLLRHIVGQLLRRQDDGIDSYYKGFSGSNYAMTSDEYTAGTSKVGPTGTNATHVVDTSQASGGNSTSTILAEVAKEINANAVPLDTTENGYYPVYTDVPRGNAGYCAWHSAGTIDGQRVQFAFFFNLDGDPWEGGPAARHRSGSRDQGGAHVGT